MFKAQQMHHFRRRFMCIYPSIQWMFPINEKYELLYVYLLLNCIFMMK